MKKLSLIPKEIEDEVIAFAQDLIRIQSFSGQEEEAIRLIAQKMQSLGYDEVTIDKIGNVVGIVGHGDKVLMFDSHVDTVTVPDAEEWAIPPFSGTIVNGRLHGRGSVDMKSSIATSIYAGAMAKKQGLLKGKKIIVSCTVFEEDCDGVNLKYLFEDLKIRPDFMVICEPSNNLITLGHKGKVQVVITTKGVSAHGAEPQKGKNAVYEMSEIIQRVEKLNQQLHSKEEQNGTIILSKINSESASLNAVPTSCEIYLDRRLALGESLAQIEQEMEALLVGKDASWKIGTLNRVSWTGLAFTYEPYHKAWKIDPDHELTKACQKSYLDAFGNPPEKFDYWNFSTNAVTPVELGIPCIGFGPGDYKLAHMRDENCEVSQIIEACHFYLALIQNI